MSSGRDAPLAVCYGTRPQVIKASILVDVLAERWKLLTIDTGQHYDYQLNALLYEQLGVREPDFVLGVGSGDHAGQTSAILTRAAEVLGLHRPWGAVVIGDTNSTLGCALAAAKLRIPVFHVEAGLRADDVQMAEEINRRVVDAISTVLCAPSAAAEQRLRRERDGAWIARTGDIARDVLVRNLGRARRPESGEDWPVDPAAAAFVFATLHRAELTDSVERLAGVLLAMDRLGLPVLFSAHPRTRATLERRGVLDRLSPMVHVQPPLGYFETLACIRDAAVVITDSGGVQREAYWLGTPCITMRCETEWSETVQLGANELLCPEHGEAELASMATRRIVEKRSGHDWDRDAYGAGDAAYRIRAAIDAWRSSNRL